MRWHLGLSAMLLLVGCFSSNAQSGEQTFAPICTIPDFDVQDFFVESCGTSACHGAGHEVRPGNDLDLESADLYERLMGQFATHPECSDMPILDPLSWQDGYLVRTLRGDRDVCTDHLTFIGIRPAAEVECVGRWMILGPEG